MLVHGQQGTEGKWRHLLNQDGVTGSVALEALKQKLFLLKSEILLTAHAALATLRRLSPQNVLHMLLLLCIGSGGIRTFLSQILKQKYLEIPGEPGVYIFL